MEISLSATPDYSIWSFCYAKGQLPRDFTEGCTIEARGFQRDLAAFRKAGAAELRDCLALAYEGAAFIEVAPLEAIERSAEISPEVLNNTNRMRLHVFANGARDQALLVAIYDNLGKGASGAAVQNLNLMIGADERLGADLKIAA